MNQKWASTKQKTSIEIYSSKMDSHQQRQALDIPFTTTLVQIWITLFCLFNSIAILPTLFLRCIKEFLCHHKLPSHFLTKKLNGLYLWRTKTKRNYRKTSLASSQNGQKNNFIKPIVSRRMRVPQKWGNRWEMLFHRAKHNNPKLVEISLHFVSLRPK